MHAKGGFWSVLWTMYKGRLTFSSGEGDALGTSAAGCSKAMSGSLARVSARGGTEGSGALGVVSAPDPCFPIALCLPVVTTQAPILDQPAKAGITRAVAGVASALDAPAKAGTPGALAEVSFGVMAWGRGGVGCGCGRISWG